MPFRLNISNVGVALPGIHAPAAVHVVVCRGDHTPASDAMTKNSLRYRGFRFLLCLDPHRFRGNLFLVLDIRSGIVGPELLRSLAAFEQSSDWFIQVSDLPFPVFLLGDPDQAHDLERDVLELGTVLLPPAQHPELLVVHLRVLVKVHRRDHRELLIHVQLGVEILDAGDVGVAQSLQPGHRPLVEFPLPVDDEYIHAFPVRDLDGPPELLVDLQIRADDDQMLPCILRDVGDPGVRLKGVEDEGHDWTPTNMLMYDPFLIVIVDTII